MFIRVENGFAGYTACISNASRNLTSSSGLTESEARGVTSDAVDYGKVCRCLYSTLIGLPEQSSGNQPVVTDRDHGQYVAEPSPGLGSGLRTSDRAGVAATSTPGQAALVVSSRHRLFKIYFNISNTAIHHISEAKYLHRLLHQLLERPTELVNLLHQLVTFVNCPV